MQWFLTGAIVPPSGRFGIPGGRFEITKWLSKWQPAVCTLTAHARHTSACPACGRLLLAYVRFVDDGKFQEELLFCDTFATTTKASDIYNLVVNYFADKEIPFSSVFACSADGAPAMMGKDNGCLKLLKDNQPSMLSIHCVIHRQNLASKRLSEELHTVMKAVIGCVNAIKANPKCERLFGKFCAD